MSLTAIVTNHDYGRYLPQCLESALHYCDEVLVYDDGSTDDSLEILSAYPVIVTHRVMASGTPVWGSNQGIEDATSTHLIFLDADNWLISQPPENDVDYTFAALKIVKERSARTTYWTYPAWPLTARGCWDHFVEHVTKKKGYPIPFPWGGVWRTAFLKGKTWRPFETTGFACDFRTALDWCKDDPTLAYHEDPFLVFRKHQGQWSESPERAVMQAELDRIAAEESFDG